MAPLSILLFAAALFTTTIAHGSHAPDSSGETDWATIHMIEEHHISNFDPTSFFSLHDFNSDGVWTPDEVRRIYGLDDESLKGTSKEVKDGVVKQVFAIFDASNTGEITKQAWLDLIRAGKALPDFGLGPGHHGDDEYEYEIHHFEKFHDENTREEDLTHPEDIAHFRKHDEMEDELERVEIQQQQQIVEVNIPMKFRKQQ